MLGLRIRDFVLGVVAYVNDSECCLLAIFRLPVQVSPTAWAKLLFFRERGESEIGGFGIARSNDLLFVEEFSTVKQEVTMASVAFDDQAVADFFESQVDAGRKPEQFGRIWLHTHLGTSPQPSGTDENTFLRVFGRCQWAVMFILAEGQSYAKLKFNVGPSGEQRIPVEVDFNYPFAGSDFSSWELEYQANIASGSFFKSWPADESNAGNLRHSLRSAEKWQKELADMDYVERLQYAEELEQWPAELEAAHE